MVRTSSGRLGIRVLVVTLFVALTGVVFTTTPVAQASTGGGATAQAVDITLAAAPPVFGGINLVGPIAAAPAVNGAESQNGIGIAAGVTIGAITNTATRGPVSTSATSTIASASVDLQIPTVPAVLQTGVLSAQVTCPFAGAATSVATAASVTVLGQAVTVTQVGATVQFPAAPAVPLVSATISEVQATTPTVATAIVVDVDVTVLGLPINVGTITLANAACVAPDVPDAPTATSLSPTQGPPDPNSTAVTVTGTNFIPDGTIGIVNHPDGTRTETPVVAVNAAGSTATFSVNGVPGIHTIQLRTAGGTTTPPLPFEILPVPTASSLAPTTGPTAGGTPVTVTGSGFITGATSVTIGGTPVPAAAVTVVNATTLTFTTPAHAGGPADVTVTTIGGTSNPALIFTYIPPPTITSLDPDFGPTGGGTVVNVGGSGFEVGQTTITVGATTIPASEVNVIDAVQLTFTTPPGAGPGPVDVTATVPIAGESAPATFTYFDVPTLSSIEPAAGPVAGGNTVVVTGTGFVTGQTNFIVEDPVNIFHLVPAAAVTFGGGGTTATFAMPASTALIAGAATVVADLPGVGTSATLPYTYLPLPTVASITPVAGPTSGGTPVSIVGTNFLVGATDVELGGVPALNVVVAPDGLSLTATTPPNVEGPAAVIVTTAGGDSVDDVEFTYFAVPTVATIAPAFGPLVGGTSVTLTGQDFAPGATSVTFDERASAPNVLVDAGWSLVDGDDAGPRRGPVPVVVTTPGGPSVDAITFNYVPVPTATGIAPVDGPVTGGTSVTITGSGFVDGQTTVTIGGNTVLAADVTVTSATSLTFPRRRTPPARST